MSVALLFPGQGSQHPGMFAPLRSDPIADETFDEAREAVGEDLFGDDAAHLSSTVGVQLALLVASVASVRSAQAQGLHADMLSGHSVGAFAAAVIAESIAFDDALRAVHARARAMAEAFPQGYGMAAIVGPTEAAIEKLAVEMRAHGGVVYLANVNAPDQCVLAGDDPSLERALEGARAIGARKAERLNVAVPSHCPLLGPVQKQLARELAGVEIRVPRVALIGSAGPRVLRDAEAVRDDLTANVALPVRWYDATTLLRELGAALFIEAAPGRVLTELAEAAFPQCRAIALEETGTRSAASLALRFGLHG